MIEEKKCTTWQHRIRGVSQTYPPNTKSHLSKEPVGFTRNFVPDCLQTVYLAVQTLTPLFALTVLNFVVFFMVLNRKFNEDSKNVLRTVIFSLQVGFTGDFVPECPSKLCFWQFKL